jgi:hypothetical protein
VGARGGQWAGTSGSGMVAGWVGGRMAGWLGRWEAQAGQQAVALAAGRWGSDHTTKLQQRLVCWALFPGEIGDSG